jgi:hypothetical protein
MFSMSVADEVAAAAAFLLPPASLLAALLLLLLLLLAAPAGPLPKVGLAARALANSPCCLLLAEPAAAVSCSRAARMRSSVALAM